MSQLKPRILTCCPYDRLRENGVVTGVIFSCVFVPLEHSTLTCKIAKLFERNRNLYLPRHEHPNSTALFPEAIQHRSTWLLAEPALRAEKHFFLARCVRNDNWADQGKLVGIIENKTPDSIVYKRSKQRTVFVKGEQSSLTEFMSIGESQLWAANNGLSWLTDFEMKLLELQK